MLQCCNVASCSKAMLKCCMCSTRGERHAKFDIFIFAGNPPPRLPSMLKEWKDEYRVWMRPEALQDAEGMSKQQWHQYLRKAFRSHLFNFMGCYEMTMCFLIAPLNTETLKIFQLAVDQTSHLSHDAKRSKACIERFTTLGREAVAAPETPNAFVSQPSVLDARPKRRLPSRMCSPASDCSDVWQ